jgi:hypothetical protein
MEAISLLLSIACLLLNVALALHVRSMCRMTMAVCVATRAEDGGSHQDASATADEDASTWGRG